MSKFCPFCGTATDDASVFCANCGNKIELAPAPVAEPAPQPVYQEPVYQEPVPQPVYQEPVYQEPAPQPVYQEPVYQEPAPQPVYQEPVYQEPVYQQPVYQQPVYGQPQHQPQPAKKKKPVGLFIGIGAAATALLTLVLFLLFRAPYGSALKNYMNAKYMYEPKSVEDLMPEEVWDDLEYYYGDDVYYYEELFDAYHYDHIIDMEDQYGSDFEFTYEILEKDKVSSGKLGRIANQLEDDYYIDPDDVTQGYFLTIKVRMKGSYDSTSEVIDVLVLKIDNHWYVLEIDDWDGDPYYSFIFW